MELKHLKLNWIKQIKLKLFLIGNLLDCESIFSFKNFLDKINANNYDCRQDNSYYFIPSKRSSYLFNSSISGIDESDLCVIIGSDIRKEAPIIGARIRKRVSENEKNFPILRIGHKYDLTLDVKEIGESYSSLTNLRSKNLNSIFNNSKKPLFLIGQGPLCSPDAENIFHFVLNLHNEIVKDKSWNGFNILQTYSGRVGALDLEFYNKNNVKKNHINEIYKGKYELLILFGADEIDFDKIPKNTYIVYIGHHGDKAVSRADLIIPTPCFTEKEGIYVNIEGRAQVSRQIKLPIAQVEHSFMFFNKVLNEMGRSIDFKNFQDLRNAMFDQHPNLEKINKINIEKNLKAKINKC